MISRNIDTDLEVATASTTNLPLPECLKVKIRAHIDSEKEQLAILDEEIRRTQALLDKLRQQHTHRSTQLEPYQMCIATFPERFCPKSSFGPSQYVESPSQGQTCTHRGTSPAFAPCGGSLRSTCPIYGHGLTFILRVQTPLALTFVQYMRCSVQAKTGPFLYAPVCVLTLQTRDFSHSK